jgi:hypothetical protein
MPTNPDTAHTARARQSAIKNVTSSAAKSASPAAATAAAPIIFKGPTDDLDGEDSMVISKDELLADELELPNKASAFTEEFEVVDKDELAADEDLTVVDHMVPFTEKVS